jgi:hypothetical protein
VDIITKDKVWRNLLEYINSQDIFFPDLVRNRLNPGAAEILDEFIDLMLRHKMIVPFKRCSLAHRFAYFILWIKLRIFKRKKKMPQIFVRGPGWAEPGGQSLDELAGDEAEVVK